MRSSSVGTLEEDEPPSRHDNTVVPTAERSSDDPQHGRLLDGEQGKISRILLAVSEYGARTFGTSIRNVLARLPREARLDILVAPQVLDQVSRWLNEAGPGEVATLIEAPENLAFSLWTQDLFLAYETAGLAVPPHFQRYQDLNAAKILASGAEVKLGTSSLYFEGGNIIAAGDWLLIGEDMLGQNHSDAATITGKLDPTRKPVVLGTDLGGAAETRRATERPEPGWTETIHWRMPEGSRQPLFHIDLFISPAGQGAHGQPRFMVGCPRRGAELLGHSVMPQALADGFDRIAEQLAGHGAEVIRNPMPLIWKDLPEKKERLWYHLPVNNVLVEDTGPGGKTVWLPSFASETWPEIQAIDDTNAAIWAMLGYSVIRIPGLMPLAENLGALHCMAKVVERR